LEEGKKRVRKIRSPFSSLRCRSGKHIDTRGLNNAQGIKGKKGGTTERKKKQRVATIHQEGKKRKRVEIRGGDTTI